MKRLRSFLLVLICSSLLHAADRDAIKVIPDVPYVPNGDANQKLDLYLPTHSGDQPLPLIIWIHGGGWQRGSKAAMPAKAWVPEGFIGASVEYRFSPAFHFPAQIQDCQAAVRFLRAHASEYHIDPDRIGVWGSSAGGHLAALLGTAGGKNAFPKIGGNDDQSDRVQAVVDQYGPADFSAVVKQAADDPRVKNHYKFNENDPYSALLGVPLGSDPAKEQSASPAHFVSADAPPFLIMHGQMDPIVPYGQSEELFAALQKAKVPALLQPFPTAGHSGPEFGLAIVREMVHAFFNHTLNHQGEMPKLLDPKLLVAPSTQPTEH